jgi:hypothetical protein
MATQSVTSPTDLELYEGTGFNYASGPAPVTVPAPVASIILGYVHGKSALFLFTDVNNNLYTNYNFTNQYTQVPNIQVTQGSAVLNQAGLLQFYGVTPDNELWVLHQTAWGSSGPVWAPSIPLDVNISSVCVNTNQQKIPHFLATSQTDFLRQYSLDPAKRVWRGSLVQQPSPQAFYVNQYRTQISVIDSSGNPVPNVPVSITAEVECAISSGSQVYPVGPNEPATIATDNFGQVNLAMVATQLSSPTLTATAPNIAEAITIEPSRHVQNWLSGEGPLGSAGTLSGDTLINGTLRNGNKVAPGLQKISHPKAQQYAANKAADGVITSMTMASDDSSANGIAGFAFDLTDPENPQYRTFASKDELDAYTAQLAAPSAADSSRGFFQNIWGDLEDFAEDVWHGIETAAIKVCHWVVNTAEKFCNLVVKIGDAFYSLLGMVLEGFEDIMSLVQSIFNAIEAFVDKLINFVLALFDWSAIWNTTLAFEQAIAGTFGWAQDMIGKAENKLDKSFFDKLRVETVRGFATLEKKLGGNQSLLDLVNSFSPPPSSNAPLTGAHAFSAHTLTSGPQGSMTPAGINGNVQSGWMLNKVTTYAGTLPPSTDQPPSTTEALKEFLQELEKAGKQAYKALEDFGKFIVDTVKDPRDFTSLALVDLLKAMERLVFAVIDLAQAVVDALLNVLLIGITWIEDFMKQPLEIPLVSELFKLFQEVANKGATPQPMCIGNLMSLVLAVPVTIAYETVYGHGQQPFPNGQLPTATDAAFSAKAGAGRAAPASPAPGTGNAASAAQSGIQFTAGTLAAMWALADTGLDAVPTMSWWPFTAAGLVVPALINVLTWPGGIPFVTFSDEFYYNTLNWLASWIPIGVDGMFIAIDPALKRLARYNEAPGMITMSLAGSFCMATGIAASIEGEHDLPTIAGNILGPCSPLFEFLRIQALNVETAEVPYACKLLIDFFTGEGAAVALFAQ